MIKRVIYVAGTPDGQSRLRRGFPLFLLFFSFFTRSQPFRVPCTQRGPPRVVLHARARAAAAVERALYCTRARARARVNYELRKIVSEDDLHRQWAARKGIDVPGPGSFFMPRRGEGRRKRGKKRVRRSPGFLCMPKFPRAPTTLARIVQP
jgi:hypothetical protein